MSCFSEQKELIKFARDFVKDRIDSLEKDVKYCLQEPHDLSSAAFAPFPALLYCFSTIDLLGSLYAGDASRSADTVNNSKKYAQHFMNYTEEQIHFTIQIFRHKLVHLAQPKFVYQDRSKHRHITWAYFHDDREKHLRIEKLPPNSKIVVTSYWDIPVDHVFMIGILQLMNDIKNSTEGPRGYLQSLETTPDLQVRFKKAIKHIFSS
jgi:hypothetical protein